ncbi:MULTISPECIES: hypothetical protein [unclassified Paenibacillus]|uniref:hypothetical protein n=1 Tax=unclassified Paenibacillus TaxID=185978 RepID=UPI003638929F
MSRICDINCPINYNDIFVTAEFEKTVSVWSMIKMEKLATFDTVMDFGGSRLAVIPTENPLVVAGAYERYGVCGYNAITGGLLWQRKDLKKVQIIRWMPISSKGVLVGAGFDTKPYLILNALTGETEQSLRGVREVYLHENGEFAIQTTDSEVRLCNLPDWKVAWKKKGRLNRAAFNDEQVLLTWADGTRCFNLNGQELWNVENNFMEITWHKKLGHWLGIQHFGNRNEGKGMEIVQLDTNGDVVFKTNIGLTSSWGFFADGGHLVTSSGEVLSIPELEIVWDLNQ